MYALYTPTRARDTSDAVQNAILTCVVFEQAGYLSLAVKCTRKPRPNLDNSSNFPFHHSDNKS